MNFFPLWQCYKRALESHSFPICSLFAVISIPFNAWVANLSASVLDFRGTNLYAAWIPRTFNFSSILLAQTDKSFSITGHPRSYG